MKIKKNIIIKIILWIIVLVIWILIFPQEIHHTDDPQLCFKKYCYILEIADTPNLRTQWLMNRNYLWENSWMIFIFQEDGIHKFWMKNTLIPLDMIRLNKDFQIIDIATAQPCKQEICPTYWPDSLSTYVLEINWWLSEKIWLKKWDTMKKYGNR